MPALIWSASGPGISNRRRCAGCHTVLGTARQDRGQRYRRGKNDLSGSVRHRRVLKEGRRIGRKCIRTVGAVWGAGSDPEGDRQVFGGEEEVELLAGRLVLGSSGAGLSCRAELVC